MFNVPCEELVSGRKRNISGGGNGTTPSSMHAALRKLVRENGGSREEEGEGKGGGIGRGRRRGGEVLSLK